MSQPEGKFPVEGFRFPVRGDYFTLMFSGFRKARARAPRWHWRRRRPTTNRARHPWMRGVAPIAGGFATTDSSSW